MNEIIFDTYNPIPIKDLVRLMDRLDLGGKPVTFCLIAFSCNYAKNEGGEIILFENVVQYRNVKLILEESREIEIKQSLIPKIPAKLSDRIRRIYNPDDDTIRNVNIRYITHFKFSSELKYKRITY